jgi:hypothetical protein
MTIIFGLQRHQKRYLIITIWNLLLTFGAYLLFITNPAKIIILFYNSFIQIQIRDYAEI